MTDYYKLLGAQANAGKKEIERAYKKRIADWEKQGGNDMQEYLDIEEAHRHLTDDLLRKWHDEKLQNKPGDNDGDSYLPPAGYKPPVRSSYRRNPVSKFTGWAALLVAAKLIHAFHFLIPNDPDPPRYTLHFAKAPAPVNLDSLMQSAKQDSVKAGLRNSGSTDSEAVSPLYLAPNSRR